MNTISNSEFDVLNRPNKEESLKQGDIVEAVPFLLVPTTMKILEGEESHKSLGPPKAKVKDYAKA